MDGKLIKERRTTPGFVNRVWYRWQFPNGTTVPVRSTCPRLAEEAAKAWAPFKPSREPEQSTLFAKGRRKYE